jgi:hypothetical protein
MTHQTAAQTSSIATSVQKTASAIGSSAANHAPVMDTVVADDLVQRSSSSFSTSRGDYTAAPTVRSITGVGEALAARWPLTQAYRSKNHADHGRTEDLKNVSPDSGRTGQQQDASGV